MYRKAFKWSLWEGERKLEMLKAAGVRKTGIYEVKS